MPVYIGLEWWIGPSLTCGNSL